MISNLSHTGLICRQMFFLTNNHSVEVLRMHFSQLDHQSLLLNVLIICGWEKLRFIGFSV